MDPRDDAFSFRTRASALFIGTLAAFVASYRLFSIGGWTFEFCHYAEIARNILRGRGFTTGTYCPTELAYLNKAGIHALQSTGPVVARFPLYGHWCALWLGLAGIGDFGMALSNGVAHALWVVIVYWAGRIFFKERTALISAVLWALHPSMLAGFDQLGYPDVFFGALFMLLNALWLRLILRGEQASLRGYAGLGFLAGLASLTRTSFSIWLPFYAAGAACSMGRRRWQAAGCLLAASSLCCLPWFIYCLRHLGELSPHLFTINLASDVLTSGLPWMDYRTYAFSDFSSRDIMTRIAWKWGLNACLFLKEMPSYWLPAPLSIVGLAGMVEETGAAARLSRWVAALAAWQVAVFSLLRYENIPGLNGRYYLWLAPFLILYGVAFLERRWPSRPWRLAAIAALIFLLGSWANFYRGRAKLKLHPVSQWPELAYLRAQTPSQAWIVTNIPTQIAWYAEHRTMNITNDPQDLPKLLAHWPAQYLYISMSVVGELPFNYPLWAEMLADGPGRKPELALARLGFKIEKVFPHGVLLRSITAQ